MLTDFWSRCGSGVVSINVQDRKSASFPFHHYILDTRLSNAKKITIIRPMEKDRTITPNKKQGGKAISYLYAATSQAFPLLSRGIPALWDTRAKRKWALPEEHGKRVRQGTSQERSERTCCRVRHPHQPKAFYNSSAYAFLLHSKCM